MTLPGFTADAAVGPASQTYGYDWAGSASAAGVVPAAGLITRFPLIRCCKYSPMFGRVVCVYHRQHPGQACQCTSDYLGNPLILCKDLVFTPD